MKARLKKGVRLKNVKKENGGTFVCTRVSEAHDIAAMVSLLRLTSKQRGWIQSEGQS